MTPKILSQARIRLKALHGVPKLDAEGRPILRKGKPVKTTWADVAAQTMGSARSQGFVFLVADGKRQPSPKLLAALGLTPRKHERVTGGGGVRKRFSRRAGRIVALSVQLYMQTTGSTDPELTRISEELWRDCTDAG